MKHSHLRRADRKRVSQACYSVPDLSIRISITAWQTGRVPDFGIIAYLILLALGAILLAAITGVWVLLRHRRERNQVQRSEDPTP